MLPTYDVFLCYRHENRALAERFARRLRKDGHRVFYDQCDLIPGRPWQEQLEAALAASRTYAVLVDSGDLGPWQNEEIRVALSERVRERPKQVIPILLPGASEDVLPLFLRGLVYVDFRVGLQDDEAFRRLTSAIRGVAPGPGPGGDAEPTTQSPQLTATKDGTRTTTEPASEGPKKTFLERWQVRLTFVATLLAILILVGLDVPLKLRQLLTTTPPPPMAANGQTQATQPLRGEILDEETRKPIPGVRVWLPAYNLETTTNELGTFAFEVPEERLRRVKLRASVDGYEALNQDPTVGTEHQNIYKMRKSP